MAAVVAFLGLSSWSSLGHSPAVAGPATAAPGAGRPARPQALSSAAVAASSDGCGASAAGGGGLGASTAFGLTAVLSAAAAARRRNRDHRAGLVVVRGRNYECNIKRKKGPAEAKKARVTAKHLSKVILAVKDGGANEEFNPTLTRVIKMALKDNVPRSTIDNRIKKYLEGGEQVSEIAIAGVVGGGVAVMVECVTDNTQRTRMHVREAFKEVGSEIGQDGCVDHFFQKQGVLTFTDADEDTVTEAGLEADAEDCRTKEDGSIEVIVTTDNFHSAQEAFEKMKLEPASCNIVYEPTTESELIDKNAYNMKHLLFLLEDIDDVTGIHHNATFAEDSMELQLNTYGAPLKYASVMKKR